MNALDGLKGLTLLLLCQSVGEAVSRLLQWPLPGPVLGLLLMWVLLNVPAVRAPVAAATMPLLGHLSLLFVPVGVGVIVHLDLLARYGPRMLLALLLSTFIGLAVTALVLRALMPVDGPAVGPADAPTRAPQV
ncbi:Antiholin-like protein LrgA [Rubrivivax sp. A210]|uniref:CidA/LrgA family protein n=1 Tax=Rubrivivax sp. A210 TaxID=2772301 RepID=UPI0019188DCE|nr:CidA/LrgA family protein [Rubrivivax sp. A210]CAD5370311.1 Antiholin-like protein LrgA [Rubrivivax sp. A210]